MSVKETIMGYRVIAYVPVDEWLEQERAEGEARNVAELIKTHVSPHALIGKCIDIETDVSRTCEHCGSPWGEDSRFYNGGCCHEDEERRRGGATNEKDGTCALSPPDPEGRALQE